MWVLILLSVVPRGLVLEDHVDLVEVNHFYDEQGRLVFDQIIWWGMYPDGLHVREWRNLMTGGAAASLPVHIPGGGYRSFWWDSDRLRLVTATTFTESWTQHDPELADREFVPKELRRLFRRSPHKWPP